MDTVTETMRSIESMFKRNEPENVEKALSLSSKRVRELLIQHNKENKVTFANRFNPVRQRDGATYTGIGLHGNYAELNKLLSIMEIGNEVTILKESRPNVHNFARCVNKKFNTTVEGAYEGFILVKRIE